MKGNFEVRYTVRRNDGLYITGFVDPGRAGSFDPTTGKTYSKDGEELDPWSSSVHECVRLASKYSQEESPNLFVQVAPQLWAVFEPSYSQRIITPNENCPQGETLTLTNSQMAYLWDSKDAAETIAFRVSGSVVEPRRVKVKDRLKV